MRRTALAVLAVMVAPAFMAGALGDGPQHASSICGKEDYPDAGRFVDVGVVNATLWRALRDAGGFANGTEGRGAVEVRIPDGGTVYIVRLEEVVERSYVGGTPQDVATVVLTVRDEAQGGPVQDALAFTRIGPGRGGGNLTLVAWLSGGALEVFWRWAYLACSEEFPNLYYVFHGRIAGGAITDDNALVYFEASRPKRGPPTDLIVLVVAGVAASVIFLWGRRALKGRGSPPDDSGGHTVK